MADERDPRLTKHYRELEALEPPTELDQAVLAASRRATGRGRNRWYTSLAAAAVLVFAVALTLHIERDRPDADATSGPQLRLERELRGVIKPAPKEESKKESTPRPPAFAPDPQARAPQPARAAPAPSPRADQERLQAERAAGAAAAAPEKPERWLERIAELRSRGRHVDADRELAAFRKAYPNYQLSELMRERVEGTVVPAR